MRQNSTYSFEPGPFQQQGLGTNMMIGLGRAAGLLWVPIGINAETTIHKKLHETHPLYLGVKTQKGGNNASSTHSHILHHICLTLQTMNGEKKNSKFI